MAYAVILCGGSGTRLWPMSRRNFPKQFLKLYGDKSLLQETYLRNRDFFLPEQIFFVTNVGNAKNVEKQIREVEKDFTEKQIIIEPTARNTTGAIALSIKYLVDVVKISEADPILFLPSDHYIGDSEAYLKTLKHALGALGDFIGTIGIVPTRVHTGLGHIHKGEAKPDGSFSVLEFKEKPDAATAEKYMASGEYLWNSGMYLFNARTFFQELSTHAPLVAAFFTDDFQEVLEKYATVPSIAIDYAISEKSKKVIMFAGDFGWSDIGSFDVLADIVGHNPAARQVGIDSKNVYTYSSENRLIATIGVEDLIIVETKGSILVCKRGRSDDVKKMVEKLKENEEKEL